MDKKTYYREYRKKHLKKIRQSAREWARKHPKPYYWNEAKKETQRKYRVKHKEKIAIKRRKYFRDKIKNDVNYRLRWLIRSRVMSAIKKQLGIKALKTIELLGCPIEVARKHIESQFEDWMTWENHGEWEIDHIIPCASYDLTKLEEQKKCFNYKNLRPLIKKDNRTKGSRIVI